MLSRVSRSWRWLRPGWVEVWHRRSEMKTINYEAGEVGVGPVLVASATEVLLKAIQTVMAGEYWVQGKQFSNLEQVCGS